MSPDVYVTTSDLKKDYMAFSFMCDRQPKEEVIYGIHHYIEGKDSNVAAVKDVVEESVRPTSGRSSEREYQGLDSDDGEDGGDQQENDGKKQTTVELELSETDKRNNVVKRMQVDSFSDLDLSDASKIQTEVVVYRSSSRLDIVDMASLSKSITFVPFDFVNLKLVSCGLSADSLKALGLALTHKKTLRYLSVEMNPLKESNQARDDSLMSDIPALSKLYHSILPRAKEESTEVDDKKKTVKKDKNAAEVPSEVKTLTDKYCGPNSSPFAPLFMTSAKYLSLRGNNLSDDDALCIAELLKCDSELFSLNMWGNSIGDVGGVALAHSLRTNQKLLSLSLAMNRIGDETFKELCKVMAPLDIIEEKEFLEIRENVYLSFYGYQNIQRDANNNNSLLIPAIPPHLQPPESTDKKKKPPPAKPVKVNPNEKEIIEWDGRTSRYVYEEPVVVQEPPKTLGVKPTAKSNSKQNITAAVVEAVVQEPKTVQPPKPIYKVPGNSLLRNINLSANAQVTDEGAQYFVDAPIWTSSNLCRISLSDTSVSLSVFEMIVSKLLSGREE